MKVPFLADDIEAAKTDDGQVWVNIRRGCENLELSTEGQLAKLKSKPWAVMKEIFMTGSDGKRYAMACLHLDALPMWLATIDAGKVKEHIREKLARYQKEAAKVLADYFFGRTQPASQQYVTRQEWMTSLIELRSFMEATSTAVASLAGSIQAIGVGRHMPLLSPTVKPDGWHTVRSYCDERGIKTTYKQREVMRNRAVNKCVRAGRPKPAKINNVYTFDLDERQYLEMAVWEVLATLIPPDRNPNGQQTFDDVLDTFKRQGINSSQS